MPDEKSNCPDCNSAMQGIKLIDATHRAVGFGDEEGMQHVELGYAAADATASFFHGKIPRLGAVRGMICPECGRIVLYGHSGG